MVVQTTVRGGNGRANNEGHGYTRIQLGYTHVEEGMT